MIEERRVFPCVFCERVRDRKYESTNLLTVVRFEPLNPVTAGHMLFIPTRHVANAATSPELVAQVFQAAAAWARTRDREFNLITSAGPNATQTIYHAHIHYVPRAMSDGLRLPWTGQKR